MLDNGIWHEAKTLKQRCDHSVPRPATNKQRWREEHDRETETEEETRIVCEAVYGNSNRMVMVHETIARYWEHGKQGNQTPRRVGCTSMRTTNEFIAAAQPHSTILGPQTLNR